jgi:hypothetical protein
MTPIGRPPAISADVGIGSRTPSRTKAQSAATIARRLNEEGVRTDLGRPWTRGTVHQVLTNEKYIGANVYRRAA